MLNEFGKFCRKLRIERNELLKDMAHRLKVTAAYLSAVEMNKRAIPLEWEEMLVSSYTLDEKKSAELKKAIDLSVKQIKIDLESYNDEKREAALMFARRLNDFDDEDLRKLFKIIKNN